MLKIVVPCWFGLGVYRGANLYNFWNKYENDHNKKINYYYSECANWAIIVGTVYLIPPVIPFVFRKEIYRLEVNLRNLTEEKNTYLL